jgi:hypothetical protein
VQERKSASAQRHSGFVQECHGNIDADANVTRSPAPASRGKIMRKTVTALAAAATLATATVALPTTADARRGWWGPALGGFAVGAIVGSALARPYYGYGYPYYGAYYAPAPVYYSYYAPAYYGYYAPRPYYSCWRRGYYGHRYRVC